MLKIKIFTKITNNYFFCLFKSILVEYQLFLTIKNWFNFVWLLSHTEKKKENKGKIPCARRISQGGVVVEK